jgi:hypothetical protein
MDTTGNLKSKDLQSHLHLYIGCEVYVFPDSTLSDGWLKMKVAEMPDLQYKYTLSIDNYHHTIERAYKPILRPLSSMAEEEAVEIYDKLYPHVGDSQTNTKKAFIIQQYCFGKGMYDENYQRLSDSLAYFPLLLSMGFDLFELIPAGLAIDKNTL